MKSGVIKILIADDHSVVRSGLTRSLTLNYPQAEIDEASDSAEIMRMMQQSIWDLVILDINIPGRNGIDILKDIKKNYPDTRVIIFSMYPEDQFAVRAIKNGASAYLTKDISMKEMSAVTEKVLNGEIHLSPSVTELITNVLRDDSEKPIHERLSDREYQVFLLIASGKSVSVIAKELSLSIKTISVYRANILQKMKLENNAAITHYAFRNNLVK